MAIPRLRKWSHTVLKDKSGTDNARVPASGVTATIYKHGGVVRTTVTVANGATNTSIDVRDSSMFKVGDVLKVWSVAGLTLSTASVTVDQITNSYVIRVDSDSNGAFVTTLGDRLVIVGPGGRLPLVYTEPSGAVGAGALTTDVNGYVQAFVRERFVDAYFSGGSISALLVEDDLSGEDEGIEYSPFNYGGGFTNTEIQAAIDAAPAGSTVVIPAGDWTITAPLTLTKEICLRGQGMTLTRLKMNASKNVNCIEASTSSVRLEDFGIDGPTGTGTGIGILVGNSGGTTVQKFEARRIQIVNSPSWGVKMGEKSAGWGYIITSLLDNVDIITPQSGGGLYMSDVFTTHVSRCAVRFTAQTGMYGVHARHAILCRFDNVEINPCGDTAAFFMEQETGSGAHYPNGNVLTALDIEGDNTAVMIHLKNVHNVTVMNCMTFLGDGGSIKCEGTEGVVLMNNHVIQHSGGTSDIVLDSATQTTLINNRKYSATNATGASCTVTETSAVATIRINNGFVTIPTYTTAATPAYAATTHPNGSMWLDTTTGKVNCYIAGAAVPLH